MTRRTAGDDLVDEDGTCTVRIDSEAPEHAFGLAVQIFSHPVLSLGYSLLRRPTLLLFSCSYFSILFVYVNLRNTSHGP